MRKTILVLALLLCGWLSLAAQTRPGASVYVAPVTGRGSKPDDNFLFHKMLLDELTVQKVIIANTQKDAEYSLFGTVAPYWGTGQFVFHLALQDNKTIAITVEGELRYGTPDDTDQLFSVLVTSLLYTIPPASAPTDPVPPASVPVVSAPPDTVPTAPVPPDNPPPDVVPEEPVKNVDWRNNWLYLGLAAKWTPGFYTGAAKQLPFPYGVQGGISAEIHFLNFMSLETGAEVQLEGVKVSTKNYPDLILEVPVLIKLVMKPGAISMLEPYVGAYLNLLQIKKTITPFLLSVGIGFQYSVKVGPGAVFLDAGGAMDMGKLKVQNVIYPARINAHIGLGYKIGLIQRETK